MRIRTRLSSIKENLAVFKFALMVEEMSGGFATMVEKWLAGIRGTDTNGCIYFYYFVPRGHFCRGPLQKNEVNEGRNLFQHSAVLKYIQ